MDGFIFFVGSGLAFFAGVLLVCSAAAAALIPKRWARSLASLACLIGLMAIVVSATPLPWWYYAIAGCTSIAWLIVLQFDKLRPQRISIMLAMIWIIAAAIELPYHFNPTLRPAEARAIVLIGDSVSAGLSDHETGTWPRIFEQAHSVKVHDYSQMGATVSSALKKIKKFELPEGIVVLEIGGNDLLGATSDARFERDLQALLAHVSQNHRQVVMFELPLPPFRNNFGRIQRTLAYKHQVRLIPKRTFLRVLTADAATLDSIHLSENGHRLMARAVWQVLQPAFE